MSFIRTQKLIENEQNLESALAPVALFCYKREDHLIKTVRALIDNFGAENTDLFIFSDGPKVNDDIEKVAAVRTFLETIKGFRSVTVVVAEENKGLQQSIVDGVQRVLNEFNRVIVLEDDIITDKTFLRFMNGALENYQDDCRVWSVSGFSYINYNPKGVYFLKQPMCWGWATWSRAWENFEPSFKKEYNLNTIDWLRFNYFNNFDYFGQYLKNKKGILKSWYIFWYLHNFTNNKLTVYPGNSLTENIGFDGSGTNSGFLDYNDEKTDAVFQTEFTPSRYDECAYKLVMKRLKFVKLSAREPCLRKVKQHLKSYITYSFHRLTSFQ